MSDESEPLPADPPRAAPDRVGAITLARHGEPALSRKIKLNAAAYDRWWAAYEAGGILPGQTAPDALLAAAREADVIYCSTRRRAIETAHAVVGGRPFASEALFVEAPLPAPGLPGFVRFGPKAWGVITRLLWYLGHSGREESRAHAWTRAKAAADRLETEARAGRDVLVLAH